MATPHVYEIRVEFASAPLTDDQIDKVMEASEPLAGVLLIAQEPGPDGLFRNTLACLAPARRPARVAAAATRVLRRALGPNLVLPPPRPA